MSVKTAYQECDPYVTRDGSTIRELMHPERHGHGRQSLAEASVPEGGVTRLHTHAVAEEIYHITAGRGLMTLGGEEFAVAPGDTIYIAPGTPHRVRNTGSGTLKILCSCCPAYRHEDTQLLE